MSQLKYYALLHKYITINKKCNHFEVRKIFTDANLFILKIFKARKILIGAILFMKKSSIIKFYEK